MGNARRSRSGLVLVARLALLAGLWASGPEAARGDRVELLGGHVVVGEILTSDSQRIVLRTEGLELTLPHGRIVAIERASPVGARIRKGFLDLVAGDVGGLRQWRDAMTATDTAEVADAAREIVALLAERRDEFREALDRIPARRRDEATTALAMLARSEAMPAEARWNLLERLARLEAHDSVAAVLHGPLGADLPDTPEARAFQVGFWREHVRRKLAGDEYPAALDAIDRLQALDPGAGRSQRALWLLARIAQVRNDDDVLEALRLAVEDLHPLLPEVAENRIAMLTGELPEWVAAPDGPAVRFERARAFLETSLAEVAPSAADAALQRLFGDRAKRWIEEGRAEETLALLETLPGRLRQRASLREVAFQAELLVRQAALDPDDPLALYRLGDWAAEQGEVVVAYRIFAHCLAHPSINPLARTRMRMLRDHADNKALERAILSYRDNRYFDALEALDPVLADDDDLTPSNFVEEAKRMANLIRSELRLESDKRPYRAEIEFQLAERAFFTSNFATALAHLTDVLQHFPDTPAAKRADILLPQVVRAIELERVQGRARATVPEISPEIRARLRAADTTRLDLEIRSLLEALETPVPAPRTDFGPQP